MQHEPSRLTFKIAVILGLMACGQIGFGQVRARTELQFPNLPGYVTLKCDFHMHTVFSDGKVWPSVRVEEAWQDGLDAIAITDHVEYQPHHADVSTNIERSYEIARAAAEPLGFIVIRSAEITRGEPPGHLNALFLKTIDPLKQTNDAEAVKAAADQGAFIFWNHPWWKQPDRKSVWYAEQGEFLEKGWLKGIEIVNGDSYEPTAHQWCVEKNLTLLGDSDVHNPIGMTYDGSEEGHRPVTLVFATERSEAAIKDALLARRTAVYTGKSLMGDEQFLKPLFTGALEVKNPLVRLTGKKRVALQVFNRSPISFELQSTGTTEEVTVQKKILLRAGRTSMIEVTGKGSNLSGKRTLALPFRIMNLKTAPDQPLVAELKVDAEFVP